MSKSFDSPAVSGSRALALERVDIEIGRGEFVALVGASGCGKTTLLNMVAGLVTPTTGTVMVSGRPARCPHMDIGYMFARPALLPWRTALHNVELGLEARGWNRRQRRERSREVLELVGLSSHAGHFPSELSQGMRQRVALARTLAPDPSIILMDEPFAALDARTKLSLQAEFLRLWERGAAHKGTDHRTVLFVTHDLQEATLLADRVVVMLPSPGRIADDRPLDLPRPRADQLGEVMFDPAFQSVHHSLFEQLEGASLGPEGRRI